MKLLAYSVLSAMVIMGSGCTNVERSRSYGNPGVNGKTIAQQVCSACHGADGNSTSPEFPKLAGQQPEYLIAQIKNFHQHARTDRLAQEVMAGMSHDWTDEQLSQIAVYFYHQKSDIASPSEKTSDEGKAIYQNGIPAKGVLACVICHGSSAEGNNTFPRLARQHKAYLVKQMLVFRDTHGRPDTPMGEISKSINDHEIQQLADYLSSLN